MAGVKLYGSRISVFSAMVHHALELKGVAYDYMEEDLENKSESLLELNPVHKKVPVLVVDGKPISESLVILEFIDEKWKESPLLPEDPYKRAKVRFWANFIYQKLVPNSFAIVQSHGKEQEKATKEYMENLSALENGIHNDLPSTGPFINGDKPGLLDVIMGSSSEGIRVLADLAGRELLEKERVPILYSCIASFMDLEVTKDTAMPYDKLLVRVCTLRDRALAAARS